MNKDHVFVTILNGTLSKILTILWGFTIIIANCLISVHLQLMMTYTLRKKIYPRETGIMLFLEVIF